MNLSWNEPGYPQLHYDRVRAAKGYALRAIAFTGIMFVILLLGTILGPIPPIAATLSCAIFVMFGLLSGFFSIYDTYYYVQAIPYFQRRLGQIDTFLAGQTIARFLTQLDAIASDQNVPLLSTFGFADDLRGEVLRWHDPKTGLRSLEAILVGLDHSQIPESVRRPLVDDLKKWHHALERAALENVLFCLLLRHESTTSGHEWDVRKGSAF